MRCVETTRTDNRVKTVIIKQLIFITRIAFAKINMYLTCAFYVGFCIRQYKFRFE